MLTTGFKLFFGFFLAAATAAVLFGYTSGGSHLGPLTAGYKGAVGNQAGYTILLSAGLLALVLAVITILLSEVLRISFGTRAVGWDNLVYGVLLVLFIVFLPKGILGSLLVHTFHADGFGPGCTPSVPDGWR